MKEMPTYIPDFEEYIRQGEPDKKERAQIWRTAIGLQQVDGLETSEYLKELAKKDIEGELSLEDVKNLLNEYHKSKRDTLKTSVYTYERQYDLIPRRTTRERLLNFLKGRPWADNKQLSFVLNISISTVRYHLRKLQKDGVIVRYHSEGYRGDTWEIIKE
jgi:DNA-binding transcriptional ArsR family regulator